LYRNVSKSKKMSAGAAQTDSAAKAGEKGAAYSGTVDVAGCGSMRSPSLALQLTLQGTKYYEDDDLNKT